MTKKRFTVDEKQLSKKYKMNVGKIIRAWKKGYSDTEISAALYVDPDLLSQLRYDIETAYLTSRYNQWIT